MKLLETLNPISDEFEQILDFLFVKSSKRWAIESFLQKWMFTVCKVEIAGNELKQAGRVHPLAH